MRAVMTTPSCSTHCVDTSLSAVEARVVNWVRWLMLDDAGKGRCGSAERNYRSQGDASEAQERRVSIQSIDAVDAQLVQQAFVSLPPNMRRLLQLWYVQQRPERRIARAFGMAESAVLPAREATLSALEARLAALERPMKLLRRGSPLWAGVAHRSIAGV